MVLKAELREIHERNYNDIYDSDGVTYKESSEACRKAMADAIFKYEETLQAITGMREVLQSLTDNIAADDGTVKRLEEMLNEVKNQALN